MVVKRTLLTLLTVGGLALAGCSNQYAVKKVDKGVDQNGQYSIKDSTASSKEDCDNYKRFKGTGANITTPWPSDEDFCGMGW